jgi:hypothetical protein
MDKDILEIIKSLQKDKTYQKEVVLQISQQFEKIKQDMLNEFDNHPVTREINDGISAFNISGTLDGITNLYSFIGFNEGDNPTKVIRDLLEKSTYKIITNTNGISSIASFEIPTSQEIFAITPMPWATGRSWARGIETGISGIGYYLKIEKNSRSGLGIQNKKQVRSNIRFKNIAYISALINKFNTQLKNLK